jgi:hypothetical protein
MLRFVALIVCFVTISTVHAGVIEMDLAVPGDGLLTYDTINKTSVARPARNFWARTLRGPRTDGTRWQTRGLSICDARRCHRAGGVGGCGMKLDTWPICRAID